MRIARAGDTPQVKVSLNRLSPEARRNRFFSPMPGFSDQLVKQLTDVDPTLEHVLLVMRRENGLEFPVGGGRFVITPDEYSAKPTRCEFALVVGDLWQRQGIARRIMQALIDEAIKRQLQQMYGHILASNSGMLALAQALGFRIETPDEDAIVLATLALPQRHVARWKKHLPDCWLS